MMDSMLGDGDKGSQHPESVTRPRKSSGGRDGGNIGGPRAAEAGGPPQAAWWGDQRRDLRDFFSDGGKRSQDAARRPKIARCRCITNALENV
mmetsp:Transcript_29185/g.74888  ORF Transcript_29185/g.74888 Transcript_29185/m.74888 type:complete len:92 (+) Transcript_29185:691-966(+)